MAARKPLRLRDFVKAKDCFFSVVGYDHSMGIKSFLRYIPSADGDRERKGLKYKKLMHEAAVRHALERDLFYNKELGIFLIPPNEVQEVYKPEERISDLLKGKFEDDELRKIVDFFGSIPAEKMGVTGSRLIGLKAEESDVDFVMYGRYWFVGRNKIRSGIERKKLSEPSSDMWDFIYKKRKVTLPYDIFLVHEKRKYHRAVLGSTYFDLLYVRDYDEIDRQIPEWRGKRVGKTIIQAEVIDDSLTFDYPAYFPLKSKKVKAILCFTHTFVGQALKGERIEARGYVEEIGGERYLVVGTSREVADEYIVSLNLIEDKSLVDEYLRWKKSLA
ncbi:MAG: DNA polymerase subunit beta [Archaeoglobus sp.]|nr:DNA polymerase subunit beta [Archaeoglobus sp.]